MRAQSWDAEALLSGLDWPSDDPGVVLRHLRIPGPNADGSGTWQRVAPPSRLFLEQEEWLGRRGWLGPMRSFQYAMRDCYLPAVISQLNEPTLLSVLVP